MQLFDFEMKYGNRLLLALGSSRNLEIKQWPLGIEICIDSHKARPSLSVREVENSTP